MKKIYLLFVIIGTFFACSDNDEPAKLSLASIDNLEIAFEGIDAKEIQMEGLGTEDIKVSVPFGTNLKALTTIKVSAKATVEPQSGTEITFIDGTSQNFVVTAEDGTQKTYRVTVIIRGEVGSGTKLKSIIIDQGWAKDVFAFTYNEETNFVATATEYEETFTYVYDSKNQITEKKSDKTIITYKYEDGLIVSAEQKEVEGGDAKLKKSYKYEYANGNLSKVETTNAKDNKVTIETYKVDDKGNTIVYTSGSEEFKNEFDDKKNPMKGIFPAAYSKIRVGKGFQSVNTNNVVKSGIMEYKYVYNKSDYPESVSYEIWGMPITVEYKYFD